MITKIFLTIRLSITAFAMNLPKNLNLNFNREICEVFAVLLSDSGNKPCGAFTY